MKRTLTATMALIALSVPALPAAAHDPAPAQAVRTDPPRNAEHPARSVPVAIPSGGVEMVGVAYVPAGEGPHPVLLMFHGLPDFSRGIDVAMAARRAGWAAIVFNYRGAWGGPGDFGFANAVEDGKAALAWLRQPETAAMLGIDSDRIALTGHSMGGWVAGRVAADDADIDGVAMVSAADMGLLAGLPDTQLQALFDGAQPGISGAPTAALIAELRRDGAGYGLMGRAEALARHPVLVLSAADQLGPTNVALAERIGAIDGASVSHTHVETDHSWSDSRIALQEALIEWLAALPD